MEDYGSYEVDCVAGTRTSSLYPGESLIAEGTRVHVKYDHGTVTAGYPTSGSVSVEEKLGPASFKFYHRSGVRSFAFRVHSARQGCVLYEGNYEPNFIDNLVDGARYHTWDTSWVRFNSWDDENSELKFERRSSTQDLSTLWTVPSGHVTQRQTYRMSCRSSV